METLTLDPNYSVLRSILAPTRSVPLGGGAQQRSRSYARVTYQFILRDEQRVQAGAEALYGFARRHQGDTPFWFDGGKWGTVSTPVLVGEGDGVRTRFPLPNRHLLSTPNVYVNAVLASPQPTIEPVQGLLTFAAAPGNTVVVTAGGYSCRYACLFWFDGEALLTLDYVYTQLFSVGLQLREWQGVVS